MKFFDYLVVELCIVSFPCCQLLSRLPYVGFHRLRVLKLCDNNISQFLFTLTDFVLTCNMVLNVQRHDS